MFENDPHSLDLTLDDLYERSQRRLSTRNPEAPVSTLMFQTKEEDFPVETKKERDGTTVVTTKEITTHRITYRVRKSDDPSLDERFPELNLFIDDSPGNSESQQNAGLLDPTKFAKQRKPMIFSKRQ